MLEALKEYAAIVAGTRDEYTQEELTVSAIRRDHPELNFMDDDEIQEIIDHANKGRDNSRKTAIGVYVANSQEYKDMMEFLSKAEKAQPASRA